MSVDWKSLYCAVNDVYAELDFEEADDQGIFELSEVVPKDPEVMTEKLERFCNMMQHAWESEEYNTTHKVYVEYDEGDHIIVVAIKLLPVEPITRIGWSEIPELKEWMEEHEEKE